MNKRLLISFTIVMVLGISVFIYASYVSIKNEPMKMNQGLHEDIFKHFDSVVLEKSNFKITFRDTTTRYISTFKIDYKTGILCHKIKLNTDKTLKDIIRWDELEVKNTHWLEVSNSPKIKGLINLYRIDLTSRVILDLDGIMETQKWLNDSTYLLNLSFKSFQLATSYQEGAYLIFTAKGSKNEKINVMLKKVNNEVLVFFMIHGGYKGELLDWKAITKE